MMPLVQRAQTTGDGRRARSWRVVVIGVIGLALLFAACADTGTNPRSDQQGKSQGPPQSGGTVTYLKAGEIAGFDPVTITNSGASDGPPAALVYDMLAYSTQAGEVELQTAESLQSDDARVWTLKLHQNIRFSDGTDYNAAAVKFNWDRLRDPANRANRAAQAQLIEHMEVLDALTLRITLREAYARFPEAVTLIPFIASPTAIAASGSNITRQPVGAGPFILKSWLRDSEMVFERNPTYWRPGHPYLDRVVLKPIVDESQRVNTFIAGQANFTFVGSAENAKRAEQGGTSHSVVLNGGLNIYFRTTKPPFDDVRARRAIAMAIDSKQYSEVVNSGLIDPIGSIFQPNSVFYDEDLTQLRFARKEAQRLFDQLAAERGSALEFKLTTFQAQNYSTAAAYVEGVLNGFRNVNVSVEPEASAVHIERCTSGDFQACVFGNIFNDPEPAWTSLYTCDATPNPTGWCNEEFDAAVSDNRLALDLEKRVEALRKAQRVFYDEVPSLYLERRYSWMVSASGVKNVVWVNDGLAMFDRMWIDGGDR